jgi:hypothetical protein
MDRLPMITTPPGTDGDFGGTTRIPGLGGFGMGKGGTGTKPALTPEQQEAEYMRRGQMPSGGTRSTTLPTPPRVDPNRDLGYGEQVPITPPGGPSTGTSPVTGTTPVTGPSPITRTGPIKTTTAIKPIASLTSQAMVDFRAGERQSLTSTKSTAVGGFFRNSPFKIAL